MPVFARPRQSISYVILIVTQQGKSEGSSASETISKCECKKGILCPNEDAENEEKREVCWYECVRVCICFIRNGGNKEVGVQKGKNTLLPVRRYEKG